MAFDNIPTIPTAQHILDGALKAGRQTKVTGKKSDDPTVRTRKRERERLIGIRQALAERLRTIPKRFPDVDALSPFYRALLGNDVDLDVYRQKLGRVQNTIPLVSKLARSANGAIAQAPTAEAVKLATNRFIGRVSSAINALGPDLLWLEEVRKMLKTYPTIKERYTLCIAGFPNVGKSTLLKRLTGANAEIAGYSFTTKGLNTGTLTLGYRQTQVIDTPGTLNRDHMNRIEQQAHLALKHVADAILYVYDLTGEYPIEDQEALRVRMEEYGKPVHNFLSKKDLLTPEQVETFSASHHTISEEQLVEWLSKNAR